MRKYITIPDIRSYPCYNNMNAVRLYIHVSMGMDVATRTYAHSWRQLASELSMPLQQLRTALKQLERDGLVTTHNATQEVTYGLTRKSTHNVTQIYILSVSDLDEATNEATNSPTNSPTNSQTNSPANSDKNNINSLNSSRLTHTNAREVLEKSEEIIMREFGLEADAAAKAVEAFLSRQAIKKKTWENEGDCLAHMISWCEKRLVSQPKAKTVRRNSKADDSQARAEEYQRTQEEAAAKTQQEKDWETVVDHWRWYNDRLKSGNKEEAEKFLQYYNQVREEYNKKYPKKEAG